MDWIGYAAAWLVSLVMTGLGMREHGRSGSARETISAQQQTIEVQDQFNARLALELERERGKSGTDPGGSRSLAVVGDTRK